MEQQLQHEREKNEAVLLPEDRSAEIASLMKSIEELTTQQEKLHIALSERVNICIENNIDIQKLSRKNVFDEIKFLGCGD